MTRDKALNLAKLWVAAWNAHDLDLIMTYYEDAVELTSPVAAQLLGTSSGKVVGKPNLRAYFQRGLDAYPELHFHLEDVLWGYKQRGALLQEPKGDAHGRVYGVVSVWKSDTSCGELRWVESWLARARRNASKVGRNDPCRSGKKYKRCCGGATVK